MAFNDEYSKPVSREATARLNQSSTILPFFGFELQSDTQTSIDTYGGNTYVSKVGTDTYKVSKSDIGFYNRTQHFLKWCRKQPILTDFELETEIQGWMKKNQFNDIWTTPYISPTADDYHRKNGYGPKNQVFLGAIIAILIVGTILSVMAAIAGVLLFSFVPEILQVFIPILALSPFASGVEIAIILLILKFFYNKKHRARPLSSRDQKYQDALRKQYYKGLVNVFGEELGNKMKNFSIQREQAQEQP